jgi:hypothetical protein
MEAYCKIYALLYIGIQLPETGWAPEPIQMCPSWELNPGHPAYSNFTKKAVLARFTEPIMGIPFCDVTQTMNFFHFYVNIIFDALHQFSR